MGKGPVADDAQGNDTQEKTGCRKWETKKSCESKGEIKCYF
jgi:hypothetical protein